MLWGRQAWRWQGLKVQVREERGLLWRGLWAGKKWMDSRDILVIVGTWEGHVWRERSKHDVQVYGWVAGWLAVQS